jgi:phosphohistidine phosphatase
MQLILWRHAEAEDHGLKPDTDRELTKKGRKQAERMAAWLRPRIGKDFRILVSPSKRTRQTVKPLERDFDLDEGVGLAATAESILKAAGWPDSEENVLVVGHQPTLGQVASVLLGAGVGDVSIRKGAVWWFNTRKGDSGLQTVLELVLGSEQVEE